VLWGGRGVSPTLLTWAVWLSVGVVWPLWPWTITGRYTGSPALKLAKRAKAWANR
jgi:hypothetical protein